MKFLRNSAYWILGVFIGIGIGTSSVILIQPAHQRSTETVQSAPDAKQEQQSTPRVSQSLLHKTSSIQKNLPSLKQWKHGPHITHHHPPQKPTTDPLDYGLSQEQINRIKARFASAEWYESDDDGRFFVYVNEEKRKGKTDEEIYEQITREKLDIYTSEIDSINVFKYLKDITPYPEHTQSGRFGKYLPELAERAIAENPNFLEGHLFLARQEFDMRGGSVGAVRDAVRAIEMYQKIVEHPDLYIALSPTDVVNSFESLGNLLMMEQPVKSIECFKQATNIDSKSGLYGLSVAYQRLGDVKTAWVYLKKLQIYPHHAEVDRYVEAIEAGKPLIDPLPRTPARPVTKQELNDFLDFAHTVLKANIPMNTNNLLLKDMEAFFKGGQPKFDPERIIRAFETFERYGAKEGIKHLKKMIPMSLQRFYSYLLKNENPKVMPLDNKVNQVLY